MTIALVIAALIILGSIAVLAMVMIYIIDELRKMSDRQDKLERIMHRIWKIDKWRNRLP